MIDLLFTTLSLGIEITSYHTDSWFGCDTYFGYVPTQSQLELYLQMDVRSEGMPAPSWHFEQHTMFLFTHFVFLQFATWKPYSWEGASKVDDRHMKLPEPNIQPWAKAIGYTAWRRASLANSQSHQQIRRCLLLQATEFQGGCYKAWL